MSAMSVRICAAVRPQWRGVSGGLIGVSDSALESLSRQLAASVTVPYFFFHRRRENHPDIVSDLAFKLRQSSNVDCLL